jgi:hypothetical protein
MNIKRHIVIGERFGRLVVLSEIPPIKTKKQFNRAVKCKCDCGKEVDVLFDRLRRKRSCGCLHIDTARETQKKNCQTHGQTKSSIYGRWQDMKRRCRVTPTKRKLKSYEHYGAKGIRVCEEWVNNFESFYTWAINNGYREDLFIDRIDNDKGYSPKNCRWVTRAQQNRNTSRNIMIGGVCLLDYCANNNLPYQTILARVRYGHSIEEALNKPIRR